jgi:membrane protein YdbS with pleckstrin-like domain
MNCAGRVNSSKRDAPPRSRRNSPRLNPCRPPMYSAFRNTCERLLRIPHDPAPPPGDEASTRIFRAAPNYYKYLLFLWALKSAAGVGIIAVALGIPMVGLCLELGRKGDPWAPLLLVFPLVVLVPVVLGCLFQLAVLRLAYEKRWYMVTDRSLRVREGVVTVREMTVNFANIQNIAISEGPIQRALGIADLRVETAGGGAANASHHHNQPMENLHTAWFRGVNNAGEVRELIQQRLRLLKDSGLGDHEELSRPESAPGPLASVAVSGSLLAALREVYSEAQALRQAAGTLEPGARPLLPRTPPTL